jgi:Ca2+/H+ antiporter
MHRSFSELQRRDVLVHVEEKENEKERERARERANIWLLVTTILIVFDVERVHRVRQVDRVPDHVRERTHFHGVIGQHCREGSCLEENAQRPVLAFPL